MGRGWGEGCGGEEGEGLGNSALVAARLHGRKIHSKLSVRPSRPQDGSAVRIYDGRSVLSRPKQRRSGLSCRAGRGWERLGGAPRGRGY